MLEVPSAEMSSNDKSGQTHATQKDLTCTVDESTGSEADPRISLRGCPNDIAAGQVSDSAVITSVSSSNNGAGDHDLPMLLRQTVGCTKTWIQAHCGSPVRSAKRWKTLTSSESGNGVQD